MQAIGYMCGKTVIDKDGISALGLFYRFANELYHMKMTVTQFLDKLYERYGFWVSRNGYYICHDPVKTERLFNSIRYTDGQKLNYPLTLGALKVLSIRDLTVGYDSEQPDQKPVLPVSSSSQMITFRLQGDVQITLRTSGTEPKIKYYSDYRGADGLITAQQKLDVLVQDILEELLQPKSNGLV